MDVVHGLSQGGAVRTAVSERRNGAASAGWHYRFDPEGNAINRDSEIYQTLAVLAHEAGILDIFSAWPARVTCYANRIGLRNNPQTPFTVNARDTSREAGMSPELSPGVESARKKPD